MIPRHIITFSFPGDFCSCSYFQNIFARLVVGAEGMLCHRQTERLKPWVNLPLNVRVNLFCLRIFHSRAICWRKSFTNNLVLPLSPGDVFSSQPPLLFTSPPKNFLLKYHIEQSHSRKTCEHCGKSLLNGFFLKKHLVFDHGITEGALFCNICPKKVFFMEGILKNHMQEKHGQENWFFTPKNFVKICQFLIQDQEMSFDKLCQKGLKEVTKIWILKCTDQYSFKGS